MKLPKCQRIACLEALGFMFPGVKIIADNLQKAKDALAQQLQHIFDNSQHLLEALVNKVGSQTQAMEKIQSAAEAAIKLTKTSGTFENLATTLQSGTATIYVNGTVINGVVHVSTAYAK